MKRLLRTPRYFDQDGEYDERCFNCGGTGHKSRDCPHPVKQRPCYICGEFGHQARRCPNTLCFRCFKPGHIARSCPTAGGRAATRKCMVCGEAGGHAAAAAAGPKGIRGTEEEVAPQLCPLADWAPADLKQAICFVCNRRGHLMCDGAGAAAGPGGDGAPGPGKVSCYVCGKPGHFGEDCKNKAMLAAAARPSAPHASSQPLAGVQCFRCGKMGHFARDCPTLAGTGAGAGAGAVGPGGQLKPWQVRQREKLEAQRQGNDFNGFLHPRQAQAQSLNGGYAAMVQQQFQFAQLQPQPQPQFFMPAPPQQPVLPVTNPNYKGTSKKRGNDFYNTGGTRKRWR